MFNKRLLLGLLSLPLLLTLTSAAKKKIGYMYFKKGWYRSMVIEPEWLNPPTKKNMKDVRIYDIDLGSKGERLTKKALQTLGRSAAYLRDVINNSSKDRDVAAYLDGIFSNAFTDGNSPQTEKDHARHASLSLDRMSKGLSINPTNKLQETPMRIIATACPDNVNPFKMPDGTADADTATLMVNCMLWMRATSLEKDKKEICPGVKWTADLYVLYTIADFAAYLAAADPDFEHFQLMPGLPLRQDYAVMTPILYAHVLLEYVTGCYKQNVPTTKTKGQPMPDVGMPQGDPESEEFQELRRKTLSIEGFPAGNPINETDVELFKMLLPPEGYTPEEVQRKFGMDSLADHIYFGDEHDGQTYFEDDSAPHGGELRV